MSINIVQKSEHGSDDWSPEPIGEPKKNDDQTREEEIYLSYCLFCNEDLSTLEANLDHMSSQHGLFIPEPEHVSDMETFVGYLNRVILRHHECLYCGIVKSSTEGIQQHMRDRGHCMINLDHEPELLEFWEFPDSDVDGEQEIPNAHSAKQRILHRRVLFERELQLPSGIVVGSRLNRSTGRYAGTGERPRKDKMKAIADGDAAEKTEFLPAAGRQVAVRGEMGLLGVPESHKRALVALEKKMEKRAAVAKAAHMWAREKVANRQHYYKVSGYSYLEVILLLTGCSQMVLLGRMVKMGCFAAPRFL
jgi:pre-60S factor REI1